VSWLVVQCSGWSLVENWVEVQMTAGNMWKSGYKYSKQQVQQLMEDIKRYKIHEEPYDCMLVDGELATLKLYWKVILSTGSNLDLPKLASTGGLLSVAILIAAFVLQCILCLHHLSICTRYIICKYTIHLR